ncbi:FtsK/SpoIIIE domain-containing protein [Nesterenkonia suensis]
MSLTLTVALTPGALCQQRWDILRRSAPGHGAYDARLRVQGASRPSGEQLEDALLTWVGTSSGALRASVNGHPLATVPSGSPRIHPGMVVVLHPADSPTAKNGSERGPAGGRGAHLPLQLCVDEGPDAGRLIPLTRGSHAVGRGPVDISLADPGIGREHCTIAVGARAVTVSSTHPAQDRRSKHRQAPWTNREPLQIGDSVLRLVTESPAPASPSSWPPPQVPVGEDPPEGKHRMMLLMACVPLVIGIVLVFVTGMWFFLLFSAVSALVAAATMADAARRRRRFRAAVDTAASQWADLADAQLDTPGVLIRRLRATGPDDGAPVSSSPQEQTPSADDISSPTAPVVRLGHGVVVPVVDVPTTTRRQEEVYVHCSVGMSLRPGEQVTIHGPRRAARRLLRWILVQLVVREAASRPAVHVVGDPARWSSLLEDHGVAFHSPDEAFTDILAAAQAPGVLVAEASVTAEVLDQALRHRWCVLAVHPPESAPVPWRDRSGWDIDLDDGMLRRSPSSTSVPSDAPGDSTEAAAAAPAPGRAHGLVVDGLSRTSMEEHLRLALPHCAVLDVEGTVPDRLEIPLPSKMLTQSAADSLVSVLGRSVSGEEPLDLVEDGPHILLAGTSGSGKSELLKSLILGWAARYSPEELSLVLFDFKGGATFQHLAELEHSLGLITDLSQAQAERTLAGIRSELVRRERLFLDAGAGDYPEYRRLRPAEPLARILVVIDEFRIFSHELPETMDELMRLATLGRSLGLHLVLSTQRPQGVVTADIRANIGSIVTLRLRSEDESRDLVGTVEAGRLPRHLPGRGILRRPGEPPILFQTGLLTSAEEELTLIPVRSRHAPEAGTATGGAATRDVVQALDRACRAAGRSRRHTPLLPPLVEELDPATARGTAEGPPVLGRLDLPPEQDQRPLWWDPARDGSLGLIGEGGSGGREAVVALASQLLSDPCGPDHPGWEVHLLDGDRSLQQFADRPGLGSWLTDEHAAEVDHLLQRLQEELTARRTRGLRDRTDDSEIVVLISGYSQWHQAAQGPAGGMMEHLLGTLISEGADVGISVLLAGGRELASGRVGSRLPRRVYLPHGVSQDTRMLWPKLRPVDPIPGRGVLLDAEHPSPGTEIQLVTVPAPDPPARTSVGAGDPRIRRPQITVHPLPELIRLDQVRQTADTVPGAAGAGCAVIGVEQFTRRPVAWDDAAVTLILGAAGTGRSNCLEVLAQQLDDAVLLSSATAWSDGPGAQTVLLDDADRLGPEKHRIIDQWIQSGTRVVGTAQPSSALYSQIPWSHHARSSPANMLLSPLHRSQADFFAVNVPVLPRPIPGRAVHLRPEGPRMVQWALSG